MVKNGKTPATIARSSTNNKPVKSIYKRANKNSKVQKNKSAVMVLSRQVKLLQNQRLGSLQGCTLFTRLTPGAGTPTVAGPICFPLNDFYANQSIYQGSLSGGIPSYSQPNTFQLPSYLADMADQYEWTPRMQDTVSNIEYKPVYRRTNITFKVKGLADYQIARARITILKLKPFQQTNKLDASLPGTLGAYRNLAVSNGLTTRNYFNPKLHTILYDRWVKFDSGAKYPQETDHDEVFVSIPWRFDNTIIKPDFTTQPPDQKFWTNVPPKDIIWCLISVNEHLTPYLQSMDINSLCQWRDRQGTLG